MKTVLLLVEEGEYNQWIREDETMNVDACRKSYEWARRMVQEGVH
ncbi:MAG: hypothetical protein KatS3mg023_4002 [Armatimonadota bacterium]|nr:MAG: hypothetical protein KatS3mg023_4002 [Armatimonadota bacterium]